MSTFLSKSPYLVFGSLLAFCVLAPVACSAGTFEDGAGTGATVTDGTGAVPGTGSTGSGTGGNGGLILDNPQCGDGNLDDTKGEYCDDGNKVTGDGCTAACQVELDWSCPVPGQMCVSLVDCGNSVLTSTEACDDGNVNPGDGCSADCKTVETGYQCRVAGRACVPLCGDSMLTGAENCDDGNNANEDGCSSTCLTEPGWDCPTPGAMCIASDCGNGVQEKGESCDAGPNNGLFFGDGTGCSKTCTHEPACRDADGTTRACDQVCGDGNIDLSEMCDDGNLVDGDGCSAACLPEGGFICTPAEKPDTSACPTGGGECLVLPVVYRDFDNTHPDFYDIETQAVHCVPNASGGPDPTTAAGVCWDSDSTELCPGLAAKTLAADGKPTLGATTTCNCRFTDWDSDLVTEAQSTSKCTSGDASPYRIEEVVPIVESADTFSQWYRDSTVSSTTTSTLVLQPIGGGRFQFSSSDGDTIADDIAEGAGANLDSGFFPLDSENGVGSAQLCNMWPYWVNFPGCAGDQWNPDANSGVGGMEDYDGMEHNFYFTSEVRYLFKYVGGEKLEFFGDDDVFVYINGQLTLDLGAPHERLLGDVVLSNTSAVATVYEADGDETVTQVPMNLVPGNTYEIAVFHADRHPRESNYQLTLQGFSTKYSECAPDCGDGTPTTGEECDDGTANDDSKYGGCTTECKFGPFCGDAQKAEGVEECDAGRENSAQYGQVDGCTSACKIPPFCGDKRIDSAFGEECDEGEGNKDGGACNLQCKLMVK